MFRRTHAARDSTRSTKVSRLGDLMTLAKSVGRKNINSNHDWFSGRPIAHKLIGMWANVNQERWVMWQGASPQLKAWNRALPPIRSMALDIGLTDSETDRLFRNPRIQTKHQLIDELEAVLHHAKQAANHDF